LSAETTIYRTRARRHRQSALVVRRALLLLLPVIAVALLVGIVFAGSPSTVAPGTSIDGVDVGGLTPREAVARLSGREAAIATTPVVFVAAGKEFRYTASGLGVQSDWRQAVAAALRDGGGFWPVRAFRRVRTRLFGNSVTAPVTAYRTPLEYAVAEISSAVDVKQVDASLVRHGLSIAVVDGHAGRVLDRTAASSAIVQALGGLRHPPTVALHVVSAPPRVTAVSLAAAARNARLALSAPVRLVHLGTVWRLPRWRVAQLLALPSGGTQRLAIGGPAADAYFAQLEKTVARTPVDATFRILAGNRVGIIPSKPGIALDVVATSRRLLAAALSTVDRSALLVVQTTQPDRTTARARAMGIVGEVSSYSTTYGGIPERLHNVALVARLIDGAMVAPGKTFSFNETTGARTAAKGFEVAPVIMNGELTTGLGGGVCQVSTTTFNAAFDAGLPITERTNHALYISHYPLGRDATVDYPGVDLKFRNDTGHWLLIRTFVAPGSLTVTIFGTPQHRRVESEVAPLSVVGPMPVKVVKDPTLKKGERVVDHPGSPATATTVFRKVYSADGKLLSDDVWRSHYVGDTQLVRVGTKKPAKPKKHKPSPPVVPAPPAVARPA
jgi:vancomycin resistance protein YoaR